MTKFWVAAPIRSVLVESTFSLPQVSVFSSRVPHVPVRSARRPQFRPGPRRPVCGKQARGLIDFEPGGSSFEGKGRFFDVKVAAHLLVVLHAGAKGLRGTGWRAPGNGTRRRLWRSPPACCRSRVEERSRSRKARCACLVRPTQRRDSRSCWQPSPRLRREAGANHWQFGGRGFSDEVGREPGIPRGHLPL